ncbi:MAG: HAMP domain-containing histidine kinase [Chitinophagales bacterium]|nr:HAMP domain-containing histidine kinase [Chitinophagales bacterium]
MKISLITVNIVLLTLSLIGIITLQGLWIRSAWDTKQEDFQRTVNAAMNNVVNRLERREVVSFIRQRYRFSEEGDVLFSQREEISMTAPGTDTTREIKRSKVVASDGLSDEMNAPHPGIVFELKKDSTLSFSDDNRISMKAGQLNDVIYQMVMELSSLKLPIDRRIPSAELQEMIRQELSNKGIELPFQFAVVRGLQDSVSTVKSAAFTPDMADNAYRVNLFPNDIFSSPYQLLLHFSDRRNYIIKSLWWMLILSAVFLLLIVATFSSAVYIILRQKKLSDIKTDFINNMTHELKTPIATISVALDAINNPKVLADQDRVRYYSSIIGNENKRMNAHVENILQMALVDKEHLNLNEQLLNVHDIIYHVSDPVRMQVEKRQGTLHLDLAAADAFVVGDETHLTNVVHNLLDNASKYSTQAPEISISTRNENNGIVISVADKGIGMSPDTQRRIFDKFYREQSGNIHNVKGFGLGLAYVKSVVKKHNGTISVVSELGKGSRFDIFLPFGHLPVMEN